MSLPSAFSPSECIPSQDPRRQVYWETKADFDGAYSIRLERYTSGHPNTRAELRGNYERRALFNSTIPQLDYVTPEWSRILAHFGWPMSTAICIVGVGFGWTIEYLNAQGYADVWGTETSPYIQGAKGAIDVNDNVQYSLVAVNVCDCNFTKPAEVAQFLALSQHRKGLGGEVPFDVVVTERVLSSLSDYEAIEMSAEIRDRDVVKVGGQVIHIETATAEDPAMQDQTMNWHTSAEWKALLPNDLFVFNGREFV